MRKGIQLANDELYTPKELFDKLGLEFDLDVASNYNEHVATPSKYRFTIEDDAFTKEWFGRVWMNPPFSKPGPWVARWLEHGNGVALLPMSGNSRWMHNLWESEASFVKLQPNTCFLNQDGKGQKIMFGLNLWAMGADNIEAIKAFGKVR